MAKGIVKPVVCPECGKKFKDKSGLAGHLRFKHGKGGEGVPRVKVVKPPEKEEHVEGEIKEVEVEVSGATKPKFKVSLDPRILTLFSLLQAKGKIPENYTLSDFINEYVLGHVYDKDKLEIAFMEVPGKSKVVVMEPKSGGEGKDPEEELKEMERSIARQLRLATYERLLSGAKQGNLSSMIEPLILLRLLPPEGHSNPELDNRLSKLESAIERLAEERRTEAMLKPIEELKELLRERGGKSSDIADILAKLEEIRAKSAEKVEEIKAELEKERREKIMKELEELRARIDKGLEESGLSKELRQQVDKVILETFNKALREAKGEKGTAETIKDLTEALSPIIKPITENVGQALAERVRQPQIIIPAQQLPQLPTETVPTVEVKPEKPKYEVK